MKYKIISTPYWITFLTSDGFWQKLPPNNVKWMHGRQACNLDRRELTSFSTNKSTGYKDFPPKKYGAQWFLGEINTKHKDVWMGKKYIAKRSFSRKNMVCNDLATEKNTGREDFSMIF